VRQAAEQKGDAKGVTVAALCRAVGVTRQAAYGQKKRRGRKEIDEAAVVELVLRERRLQFRLGGRKLLKLIRPELERMGIGMGRDRFFELLFRRHLLVPACAKAPRTTDSRHAFRTYGNLLSTLELTGPHQAWVSDITYVRTERGWTYVSLITDAYSRKIVGWHLHETLESAGSLCALKMALKQLPAGATPVHHSDRGVQYCCWEYVEALEKSGVRISMTQRNHCYENAKAERVNGILKQEYGLGETMRDPKQARGILAQAVTLYNTRRPHVSLSYRIPGEVHEEAA
jgi:putative transposase